MEMEASSGVLMIAAALLAMLAANSAIYPHYQELIYTPIGFSFGERVVEEPLKVWIKDIFMVFFFLLIGLELKREAVEGFLADRKQILLPLLAAAGGMAVPALIFFGFNYHVPENWAGWAIPSATDIAFALCVLMLAGRGTPASVKIFLLAIAIFDDLGAILIIAFFYSGALNLMALTLAMVGVAALVALNRLRVSLIMPYMLTGVYLWFCLYHAGIHTTIAGVLVGLMMPMRCADHPQHSPVNQLMHFLHPWVGFFILPVFAFTSAGVSFAGIGFAHLFDPLPLGIALALFFGKQVGIFGTTYALVRSGIASLPQGATWLQIYGVSVIAGIGFTMSLFIGILAFPDALQAEVKIGVIGGSLLSTLWGAVIFQIARRRS